MLDILPNYDKKLEIESHKQTQFLHKHEEFMQLSYVLLKDPDAEAQISFIKCNEISIGICKITIKHLIAFLTDTKLPIKFQVGKSKWFEDDILLLNSNV